MRCSSGLDKPEMLTRVGRWGSVNKVILLVKLSNPKDLTKNRFRIAEVVIEGKKLLKYWHELVQLDGRHRSKPACRTMPGTIMQDIREPQPGQQNEWGCRHKIG